MIGFPGEGLRGGLSQTCIPGAGRGPLPTPSFLTMTYNFVKGLIQYRLNPSLPSHGASLVAIDFKGSSPHDLGLVQLATAQLVEGNIEMTLHILDDWHRPSYQIVRAQMTPSLARSLAERLWGSIAQAG
jgi:hypothetical protein